MNFIELPPQKSLQHRDILALKSDGPHDSGKDQYFYLMAGVHGDEIEGIHVLKELWAIMKQSNFILPYPTIVIPTLNVDGAALKTRHNARNVDLNRNFPSKDWSSEYSNPQYAPGTSPFSEPENQFLRSLFEQYPPGFILSLHSWKPILNYNGDCRDIAVFLNQRNGYPIDDDIGYPTPGSLGTYGPEVLKCGVLTFECPTLKDSGLTLDDIWQANKRALTELLLSNFITKKCQADFHRT